MANQTNQLYKSSRLSLRLLDPTTDVDDLMVWMSDAQVSQFCSWKTYTSKDQAIAYINNFVINHPYYRVICLDNKAIGGISVDSNKGMDKCRAELGYVLGSKYWGRGIASWAVKTVLSTVFEDRPELVRVEALVDLDNKGSQRVLEKVGFLKEGVLRKYCIQKGKIQDMVVFSFLSTYDVIS
ncbi:putative N-acetyltransferase p20 [Bienertia sinuspersici]